MFVTVCFVLLLFWFAFVCRYMTSNPLRECQHAGNFTVTPVLHTTVTYAFSTFRESWQCDGLTNQNQHHTKNFLKPSPCRLHKHTTSDSSIDSVFTKDTLDEKGQARDTRVHVTLSCFLTRQRIHRSPLAEIPSCSRTGSEKRLSKRYVWPKKGPKLNVLIRDKILFVGVALLTCGGRSCSWALYRSPPCIIEGS